MKYSHILRDIDDTIIGWFENEEDAREKAKDLSGKEDWDEIAETYGVVDIDHISAVKNESLYIDLLNDCNKPIRIGSLTYTAAEVLKAVDPIAFRCGLADHLSSLVDDCYIEGPDGELYRIV